MGKPSWTDRLRYAFDNLMSRGTIALIGWLALVTLTVTLALSLLVWGARITSEELFLEQFWAYLMLTLNAEAMSGDPWSLRLAGLVVTFTGVFVTSILVGILASGIEEKLGDLRKGRSRVIETGHTVILGWSEQVFSIVSELLIANKNRPRSCIVILGNKDKVEMEDEIRDKIGDTGRTRVVCRRGNPMDMVDLDIVSLHTAKSIVIVAPASRDPDSSAIKTMLAIINNPKRRPQPYHIVAEIQEPKNMEVAQVVGADEVELILTGGLVARIMAQTCRQSGLSAVYMDLLDFAGDEIYFSAEPGLVGRSYGEALLAYEDSAVIGLCPQGDCPQLNPPMDTVIRSGDRIIAISEDDDTVRLSGQADPGIDEHAIQVTEPHKPASEHILILGWNWRTATVINELDHYVAPGSTVTVMADGVDGESELCRRCAALRNIAITFQPGDTTDRSTLDNLPFERIDHIIILAYSDILDAQQADARTLVTLLHLRDIADRAQLTYSMVSEILDIRNRKLAEVTRADDFVVSGRLISLILSQVSENKALGAVFTDIFDPEGAEIYLKPAGDYVALDRPISFYTVVAAAQRRGETAIGYRRQADANDAAQSYGVRINPPKSARIQFTEQDRVILLAEA